MSAFQLEELDHIAITVTDLTRSVAWYRDVLGLEPRHQDLWGEVPTIMYTGSSGVALFPAETAEPAPKPDTARTLGMRHFAFRANRKNFEAAQRRLKELGVDFEFQDHEIADSIYFHDPDGHRLEIATYEV